MMDGGARRRLPSWILGAGAEQPRKSGNGDEKSNVPEEVAGPRRSKARKKGAAASAVPQADDNLGGTSHDCSKDERDLAPVRSKTKWRHDKYALPQDDQTLGTSSHNYLKGEKEPAHGQSVAKRQRGKDGLSQEDRTLGTSSHDYLKGEREPAHGWSKAKRQHDKNALGQEDQTLRTNSDAYLNGQRKRSKRMFGPQYAECNAEPASTREKDNWFGTIVQISSLPGKTSVTHEGGSGNRESLAAINDEELTVEDLLSFAREYLEGKKDEKQEEQPGRQRELERENLKTASGFVNSVLRHDSAAGVSANKTSTNDTTEGVKREENTVSTPMTGDPAQDMLELLLGPLLRKSVE